MRRAAQDERERHRGSEQDADDRDQPPAHRACQTSVANAVVRLETGLDRDGGRCAPRSHAQREPCRAKIRGETDSARGGMARDEDSADLERPGVSHQQQDGHTSRQEKKHEQRTGDHGQHDVGGVHRMASA